MERVVNRNKKIAAIIENTEKVIIGKGEVIRLVITALLAGGHVLIEDVPGVGKTRMAAAIATSCGGRFNRIQMTPDVMPSDITGFTMINQISRQMEFQEGAAFCNFLLADEINRSSPKSQSALLEVMEERHISIDGVTHELPEPFMVLATQNPVETYGTYHLPEAQMDRFLLQLTMGYPEKDDEIEMLNRNIADGAAVLGQVVTVEDIVELKKGVEEVFCSDRMKRYIVDIAEASRNDDTIELGVSPRGSLALYNAARAYAFVDGRSYVLPDDIKYLAPYVLAHRLILSPSGKARWRNAKEALKAVVMSIPVLSE